MDELESLSDTTALATYSFHQFIHEKFTEARADISIIIEAENKANLDKLVMNFLGDDNKTNNDKTASTVYVNNNTSTRNETSNLSTLTNHSLDTTNTSEQQYVTMNESIADNSRIDQLDDTLYHSIMNNSKIKESIIGCLQSLPIVNLYRKEISKVIKEFESDQLRAVVKIRAGEVPIEEISKQAFMELSNLFQENVTIEKVVTLFFFCADMSLRAIDLKKRELAVEIIQWSYLYITSDVSSIIWQSGGWQKLFSKGESSFPDISPTCWKIITCLGVIGFITLLSHLNKNLRA